MYLNYYREIIKDEEQCLQQTSWRVFLIVILLRPGNIFIILKKLKKLVIFYSAYVFIYLMFIYDNVKKKNTEHGKLKKTKRKKIEHSLKQNLYLWNFMKNFKSMLKFAPDNLWHISLEGEILSGLRVTSTSTEKVTLTTFMKTLWITTFLCIIHSSLSYYLDLF